MKIAFWSELHGQTGQTSTMAAISVITSMEHFCRVLMAQTKFSHSTLESAFIRPSHIQNDIISFNDYGIDALERLARTNQLKPADIKDYTIEILKSRLDLLVGTKKPVIAMYENIINVVSTIFGHASISYDLTMIDVNSGSQDPMTLEVLRSSDLVVVNLSQNMYVLDRFFSKRDWPNVLNEKPMIYVIGNYEKESRYSNKQIARKFGVKDPIYVIPRLPAYADALNEGAIKEFFFRNRKVTREHEAGYFLNEVRRLSKAILTKAGLSNKIIGDKGA
ncbi:chromosome partitioning protein ParA [Paenibacillus thiaminolyticus]|uniref:Chromosome partitioning protein ParA n=1 Tax=Paenibacillus thiaminolyticus TaxID=49283 RepID=A0A3A3GCD9_PANTH|nr:chromosome partitioning protein ParA [Paenibacillus thiaminolyticus]RJG21344.1 chromosome partitioning protein ParA [Paenibacillus thiaminolyticus]